MNTSMTINATAAWLLALYVAVADEQGTPRTALSGTIQNDIIKEYLSRGTYVFPPAPSLRLIKDTIIFTCSAMPKWNPTNVCSYHLQEAGATPVQELAFALATAQAVLDAVKASGEAAPADFGAVVGRISFFVNAGLRFITEICKMRAFTELWDEITASRYGVSDPKHRLFRYGVQVNSLGLTEPQAENNVYRILIEMLAVTLSRDARARAAARLEQGARSAAALGPAMVDPHAADPGLRDRPAEYADVSRVPGHAPQGGRAEGRCPGRAERIDAMGGAVAAIDTKRAWSKQYRARTQDRVGRADRVGVNRWTETEGRRFTGGGPSGGRPGIEQEQVRRLAAWARNANAKAVKRRYRTRARRTRGGNVVDRRSPAPRRA
jgi:(2R)-ethylmalonyl-CoA mutase